MNDPGWRPALRGAIPFVGPFGPRGSARIVRLRSIWLAFCVGILLIAWLVQFIVPDDGDGPVSESLAIALVVIVGFAMVPAVLWLHRRPIVGGDAASLVVQYSNRFFWQLGTAEIPGMLGFIAALVTHRYVAAYIGVGFSLAGFALAAPTRRDVMKEDSRLTAALFEAGTDN